MKRTKRNLPAVALVATALLFTAIPSFAETPFAETGLVFAGATGERANGVATDAAGNLYITGQFSGTSDFDPGPGVTNLTSAGDNDAFVCKLDTSGVVLWARALGGPDSDISYAVGVDGSGGVYVTGYFNGTADFDPGVGVSNLVSAGDDDIFVCKLDANGDLAWAHGFGGTNSDRASSLAVDAAGNVHSIGWFRNTVDFDPGAGTFDLTGSSSGDVYVSKLDADGDFVWASALGGTSQDFGFGIALDGAGSVYTSGYFLGTADFDPGPGTFDLTSNGAQDAFVCVLDSGGVLSWAVSFGDTGDDRAFDVTPDGAGGAYVTGHFSGTVDLDPGSGVLEATSAGGLDTFSLRLDGSGDALWANTFGSADDDRGFSVATDSTGNALVTGYFRGSPDVDPGPDTLTLSSAGLEDVFLQKLTATGEVTWAAALGGSGFDTGRDVLEDSLGRVLLTGGFTGTVGSTELGSNADLSGVGDLDSYLLRVELLPDAEGEGEIEGEADPPSPGMPVAGWPALLALAVLGAVKLRTRT